MEPWYLVLFVCYSSYAYNRKSVTFSLPKLKEEGLDVTHAGLIISCQNVAFAIGKFLAGILSDRLSPQWLFATGLLISGTATLFFSTSSSVTTFCCLWFLNGLAQGCGWPACAKILRERASPSQFGTLWSFLSSSNNISGSLGPFISAFIIVHYGWRWSVFFAGILTLFLCVCFLLSLPHLFDSKVPESHHKKPDSHKEENEHTTFLDLFKDPFIWLLSLCYTVMICARTTAVDWGQMYLIDEKKHNQYVASAFTSSVETAGFIGRIAGGCMTDYAVKRSITISKENVPTKSLVRMTVALIFVLGTVMSVHLFRCGISESSTPVWIMWVGALMGLSYYGPIAILGIVASESFPSHLSGSSHAIVSLFGNIGATISGLPFSYIAKHYSWSTVFLLLEILSAGTLLIMIRCRKLTSNIGKSKEE